MPHSLWAIHPNLSSTQGTDRAYLQDNLGLLPGGLQRNGVMTAALAYWIGSKNLPESEVLDSGPVHHYEFAQTGRSLPQNREFVLFPTTMTAQQAEEFIMTLSPLID